MTQPGPPGPPGPLRPRSSGRLGGPMVHLAVTGSTNDHARELALAGAPGGTVVIAEQQTAGRGRQGRVWSAPPGRSLTLSVLFRPAAVPLDQTLNLLPAASALAVCEACESVAPVSCRIKWPNDIWAAERKLAGILIESRPREGWAVIGIGLNVDTSEAELGAELRQTATSLRIESGKAASRDLTFGALLTSIATRLTDVEMNRRDALLGDYRKRDALQGRRIIWLSGSKRLEGVAQGIDQRGNLVVWSDSGEQLSLDAGEVHLYGV